MTLRKNILFKLTLIYIFLIIFGFVIIGKIIYLQFFYDRELIASASTITTRYAEIEPNRGDVYSSDRKLLATSVPYFEVGIDLNCDGLTQKLFEENVDSLAYCLSKMFPHKTKQEFKNELIANRDAGSRYYRFHSGLDYQRFKEIQNFPLLRLRRYTGGFVYAKKFQRERPFGNLCRRTIGVYQSDSKHGVGLEAAFDEYLKGKAGYTVMQRISGSMWMPVSDFNHIEPRDGYDLITTINVSMQDIAETALNKRLQYHDAGFGTVVIMEVSTGKVRAIVNLTKTSMGNYIEDYNYAVGRAVDPGSTFKLAAIMAALEDGYVKPTDMVDTEDGTIDWYNLQMEDTREGGYGIISVAEAFEVSSNVGISKIIVENYELVPEKFIDRLYKLNLNKPLGVAIRGEPVPHIPYPRVGKWSGISLPQISVGYEVQMTPLQTLAFYNAIANNGCLVKPIFAEKLLYRGKTVKKFEPEIISPMICSRQTLQNAREMLIGVVNNGTARNIKSRHFQIAGKTGTAQMNYGIKNVKREYHSSFVGYFPADNPKYSMIVSIFKPQRNGYYGSVVAAPVFKEIAEKIYATKPIFFNKIDDIAIENYQVPISAKSHRTNLNNVYKWFDITTNLSQITNSEWVSGSNSDSIPKYNPIHFSDKNIVPNVYNMRANDAIKILESHGLKVELHGRGKVVRQIPRPGTRIIDTDTVELHLNI